MIVEKNDTSDVVSGFSLQRFIRVKTDGMCLRLPVVHKSSPEPRHLAPVVSIKACAVAPRPQVVSSSRPHAHTMCVSSLSQNSPEMFGLLHFFRKSVLKYAGLEISPFL